MEGPTELGDIAEIEKNTSNPNKQDKADKEIDKGIVLSVDETIDSKIEINVKDPLAEIPINEDRIIINQENSEATIATVTTIPAEEGVEVQTEVEVPVEDKDVEYDLKVLVRSPNSSTEVPLIPEFQNSTSAEQKERISNSFNSTNQQPYNKASNESQYDVKKNIGENSVTIFHYFETFEKVQEPLTRTTHDITKNYMEFQNQAIDSLQSIFSTIFENTNNLVLNNRVYCTKLRNLFKDGCHLCRKYYYNK